jgi:hypothetical protein
MTGQNFCEKVNEYLELIGEEQKGIGVIQWYENFYYLMNNLLLLLVTILHLFSHNVTALTDTLWLFVYPLS